MEFAQARAASSRRLEPLRFADAGVLNIAYYEEGPADGPVGLTFQVAARRASVIIPVIRAATGMTSISTVVAAQPIDEKASAKVASRDDV